LYNYWTLNELGAAEATQGTTATTDAIETSASATAGNCNDRKDSNSFGWGAATTFPQFREEH
jgi:hypothetical protein